MAAAPAHQVVLLENSEVKVLDTRVLRGETVPLHTHRWPSVLHIVSWSHFVRRDDRGEITLDSRETGLKPLKAMWSLALPPHTLENVGDCEIRIVSVELKRVTD